MSIVLDLTAEDDDDVEQDLNEINIVCIDPAPKNCGISVYNTGNASYIQVGTKRFSTKTQDETDLGNVHLLDSVSRYIGENSIFEQENTIVFIENQTVGSGDGHSFSNAKNVAVQYCFQSILGAQRCIPIPPASVKAHFRAQFPLLGGPKTKSSRSRQYKLDKKNAVAFGSRLVGATMKQSIASRKNKKVDDAYDAVVINQYVLECFDLEFSQEEHRVLWQRKKKKSARRAPPKKQSTRRRPRILSK